MNKILIGVVIFLVIGAYLITTRANYDLKENSQDRVSFLKDFSGWIVNLGKNVKELSGTAKDQDWLPQDYNETDSVK